MKLKMMVMCIVVLMSAACSSMTKKNYMVISTQTITGFSVGIKDTNSTPEVKLGNGRSELIFVPVFGDKVVPVLARFGFKSIWVKEGGIDSVVATGRAATNETIKTALVK